MLQIQVALGEHLIAILETMPNSCSHQKPREKRETALSHDLTMFFFLPCLLQSDTNTEKNLIFSTLLVTKIPNTIYGLQL